VRAGGVEYVKPEEHPSRLNGKACGRGGGQRGCSSSFPSLFLESQLTKIPIHLCRLFRDGRRGEGEAVGDQV